MEKLDKQLHWETIYQTKPLENVSWYQPIPETSLAFFKNYHIPLDAPIIDIGGGDSFLTDHLLNLGYNDITVLDISAKALARAQERLGDKANKVSWIVSDITNFKPERKYAVWHDRAAFHFLTEEAEIAQYATIAKQAIETNGKLLIGTFSENGPQKCSGIVIKQYTTKGMQAVFEPAFQLTSSTHIDHPTPFDTVQNFIFCTFEYMER